MKTTLIKLLRVFFVLVSVFVQAQDAQSLFKKGNEAYKIGDFTTALEAYQSIEKEGEGSAELNYNIGNCYFRLNKVGYAILNYEKALKQDPALEDAQINLVTAQKQTVDKIEQLPLPGIVRVYKGFLSVLNTEGWAKVSLGLVFLFLVFILIINFSKNSTLKKSLFLVNSVNVLLVLLTLIFAFSSSYYDKEELVLVKDNAYIKSEPTKSGKDLFILHEGTKVQLKQDNNAWIQIKLSDGLIGWVEKGAFKSI